MISFGKFLREKAYNFHSLDDITLYNKITKDDGLEEYFKTLVGDRGMFVQELKKIAKEEHLHIDDYNKVYIRFMQVHNVFDDNLED